MTREELLKHDVRKRKSIHAELTQSIRRVEKQLEHQALAGTLASRRAKRMASDTLIGCKLDRRFELLLNAIRDGKPKIPASEVVHVVDGLVARTLSRRIWITIVAILAIIPAVASLVLLGVQNKTMVAKIEAEETIDFDQDRKELMNLIGANRIRWVGSGESRVLENFNAYHPRIRSEAIAALIALEKQRWTHEERNSNPPTRYLDLREGEFFSLVIGGRLGLRKGHTSSDLTYVRFNRANFTGSALINVWLDHSSFSHCRFTGAIIMSPSAKATDFSNISAAGAHLSWNPETSDPFDIQDSTFDHANFTNAKFERVFFTRCSFKSTNLSGVTYDMANFAHCDLTKATLGNADFSKNLNALHECLVTSDQAKKIKLPSYCSYKDTDDPAIKKIVMDLKQYQASFRKHTAP